MTKSDFSFAFYDPNNLTGAKICFCLKAKELNLMAVRWLLYTYTCIPISLKSKLQIKNMRFMDSE